MVPIGKAAVSTPATTGPRCTDRSPKTESTHVLYRFYSSTGQLLYVGITHNPSGRFQKHQQLKDWWHEVAGIALETYLTREDALAAERRAIEVENPQYNIQRPPLNKKRATGQPAVTGLQWICDTCQTLVFDGDGYIHVDHIDVSMNQAATSRWKLDNRDSADMSGFFNLPKPVRWMVHHAHCDPDPDSGDYWFGVESARTHARILALTARLMAKSWLPFTDWDRFIERASRQEVC